jgi:TPR repeat protein
LRYANGKGVRQSDSRAAELYKQGCDGGSALGCGNLGASYYNGKGVRQSKSRAAELFKQGCDAGDEQACKNLKAIGR